MRFERFLAQRFFRSRKRTGFVSLITWISVGGVALGVAVLIIALSIMNGVTKELTARLLGTNAALIVLRYDQDSMPSPDSIAAEIQEVDGVTGVVPFIYGKGALKGNGRLDFSVIKGVDLDRERSVTTVAANVLPPLESLATEPGSLPKLVVGRELAARMHLAVGDEIHLINPLSGKASILGHHAKLRKFVVAAIFSSGLYEYDSTLSYIDYREAQSLFGTGANATAIEVAITDPFNAAEMEEAVLDRLGGFPYRVNTWIELNQNLFAYMALEKYLLGLLLLLIVLIAAFNIVGALTMLVMEKKQQIGILKSMGATSRDILRIFMTAGVQIGVLGIAVGVVLGMSATWIIGRQRIPIPNDVYFLDTVPVRMEALDVVGICGAVFVICWLATIYPALKAAQLDPIEAIREA